MSGDKPTHGEVGAESSMGEGKLVSASAESKTAEEMLFWINCLGAAVLVVEKDTLFIRHANDYASTFFRTGRDQLTNRVVGEVIGLDAEQMLTQIWSRSPLGRAGEAVIIHGHLSGERRMLMVQLSRLVVDGEMLRLFTFTDAPPKGSVALAGWQDNMMDILNWFPFGFEIADHDDQIHFANAHCRRLFGYYQHELETTADWWQLAYPDPAYRDFARRKWYSEIETARLEGREMTPFDLDVTAASGEIRTIQFRHRTIGNFNINLFLDVTRERAYERELKRLAGTDPLTGAINRRLFFEEMETIFEADGPRSFAILMLDLDHFKKINDTYGHAVGDLVLQQFTSRCLSLLRGGDQLARLGGEEFAILLPRTTYKTASSVAERLRAGIESQPFEIPGAMLNISVSIGGVCRLPNDTIDSVMLRADNALYDAKHSGRNQVVMKKT
ncbi:sensor domain-containing diguanylate cyclase [Acidisoma cellulosilytica]|uniref:diguanylate cyclase n=1 Tax=Acidisoma cellulosilyticum TaxID=2802395 RepID=A0A963Z8L9_9PROT|nr:sensor domain-containing diguanylate cyclase [Acidisoma cellulosilyticum]MCB8884090.1 sensor domain-containing diguanylate cyclase [Acidisoma cellulosilyticum]